MHHARLSSSPRLRRVLRALQAAGGEISSLELSRRAKTVAPGTAVSELRANGAEITCRQAVDENGQRRWFYTLKKAPKTS